MRTRIKRLKQLTQMVFSQSTLRNEWLFMSPSNRDYYHKVGDGSSSSIVMAPLQWIGRNFPEAPPALWKKTGDSGEEERVTGRGEQGGDHTMLELMARPNTFYSGSRLWMATMLDYHLSGEAYWIKLRDRGGRPRELWWTPSGLIKPVGNTRTFIKNYEYRPGSAGEGIEIPPEDIVHFRYSLDPDDPRKGRSPLSSLLHEVFTDEEASDFTAALLRNMGVPGIVVSPAAAGIAPGQGDVDATKAYLKNRFTGDKRGEPLVMSGPTSVQQFGFNPQQMELRNIRRIPEERVSACVGVPAIVAGLGAGLDRSTFANMQEARAMAYEDCLIPAQRNVSEDIHVQLLPDFEPVGAFAYRFGFDLSKVRVLQEDANQLAQRYDIGVRGGWIRVAESRRAMELEVDDADEIYLRPLNVVEVPVGEAGTSPAILSPGQGQPASPSTGQEPPPDQTSPPAPPSGTSERKSIKATRLQRRLAQALHRNRVVLTGVLAKELEGDFKGFGDACADTFIHMAPVTISSNGHGERKAVDAETLSRMVVATLLSSFDDILKRRLQAHAQRALNETIKTLADIANLTGGVHDMTQRRILDTAGKRVGLVDIEKSTRDVVFRAINEGNQAGLNPRDIARTIREDVPAGRFTNAGPAYRSQVIARTETNWAMNSSTIAAYREADEVTSCIAMDGGDDSDCVERDGQEFSFDDAEAELEKEHPNGTLTFAPVVGDRVPA